MTAFSTYFRGKITRIRSHKRIWILLGLLVGILLAGLKLLDWRMRQMARLAEQLPKMQSPELGISTHDPELKGLSEEQVAEPAAEHQVEEIPPAVDLGAGQEE